MQRSISTRGSKRMRALPFVWAVFCLVLAACGTDMYDQPKLKPYQQSDFFADGQGSRDLVPGVVSQNERPGDDVRQKGITASGENVTEIPLPVNEQLLARGQQRYNIYCAPCHGVNADGRGVAGGYFNPRPPSFYTPTLVMQPVGHYFNVITNGYGVMYSYGYRVPPDDRWAIIAYIRQLQANPPPPTPVPPAAPAATAAPAGAATPAPGATPAATAAPAP
ncbi:MAG: cytochrome c [Chloroflexales bacterium]|nr:cytochrome c [Chloroflexales bacterium]